MLAGCEGSDFTDVRTDSQGNIREVTSDKYTYADNVRLLQPDTGVEVAEITGDSLVLTGPVPPLAVGDIVVRGEGVSQFTRRVAGVTQQGDRTVLTTERVGLNDIFTEADIQETIQMGPEFLESLEPAIPGVEFGKPVMVQAQGTELQAMRMPITFNQAVVAENGRGSVIIDGEVGLRVGIRTDLQVGVRNFIIPELRRFEMTPTITLDGNVKITGTGSGDFRKEIPLSTPISYPLAGFGGLGLNLQGQLFVVVDGSVQSDGVFSIDRAGVTLEGGVRYENGSWTPVTKLEPILEVQAPSLKGEAKLAISIAQPRVSLNLCDMGEVSVNAQVIKLEAEARFVTQPSPAYDVRVYKTFDLNLGARLAIGIAPIAVKYEGQFPVLDGARTQIAQLGVPLPPPSSGDVFTLVLPHAQAAEMRVGEERLYFSLTAIQAGIAILPLPLPVRWSSSDPSVVRLQDYGLFAVGKALKSGQAAITATRTSGVTGAFPQDVSSTGLTGIQILPGLTVGVGAQALGSEQVLPQVSLGDNKIAENTSREWRAEGTYADGTKVDLTYAVNWTSDDASGASLQASGSGDTTAFRNGQVDGNWAGPSQIRVVDPVTGRSAQKSIEVVRIPIETLVIYPVSPAKIEIEGGEDIQLRASARYSDGSVREVTNFVQWTTSDSFIAKVTDQGLVTSETPGEVTIQALDPNGVAVASKTVVINQAPLARLRIRPDNAGPFLRGQTQQFKATAVFSDGTSSSATNDVKWSVTNSSAASITKGGLVTIVGPGTFRVKALSGRVSASTPEFEVKGPAGFVFTTQPADIQTGTPFSVTVEARDVNNNVWTQPLPVTLELAGGSSSADLGGNLTRTTGSDGRATFTGLTIDQVGEGYTIRAVSPGLSIAVSDEFDGLTPGSGAVGHVFFNETLAADGVGSLNVLAVAADGTFEEETGSPYNTSGVARALTKVGNFVVVAIGGSGATSNSLQSFEYDSATGSLTARGQTAQNSLGTNTLGFLKLDSGGGDIVVSLTVYENQLKSWRVGSDGTMTLLDTEQLVGTDITQVEYYDVPATSADFVYLSCKSPQQLIRYGIDSSTGALTFSNTITVPFGEPGALESYPGHLFLAQPTLDIMRHYTVNNTTGALTADTFEYTVGDGPCAIYASSGFCYVGNQISADISTFVIGETTLVPQDGGNFVAAGEINPHSFAEVSLSTQQRALYVATSNRIAAFLINSGNGLLEALTGSPFGPYDSPGNISK